MHELRWQSCAHVVPCHVYQAPVPTGMGPRSALLLKLCAVCPGTIWALCSGSKGVGTGGDTGLVPAPVLLSLTQPPQQLQP